MIIKNLSWEKYQMMIDTLTLIIKDKYPKVDFIYGIPRGGSVVAVSISHKLNLKWIQNEDDIDLWDKEKILIVDDLVDSGNTFNELINEEREGIPTATLFLREGSQFIPEVIIEKIKENVWINFPWEIQREEDLEDLDEIESPYGTYCRY